ncbi:MAG TPA: hypothetical protein VJO33_05125 [Gemmatimonadaceae bacterium]|nr:hypothetical protein [Gemmatimonadaceae bacterium]
MTPKTNPGSSFGERFAFARWYQSGHVRHETDRQFAKGVGRTQGAVSLWRKAVEPPPREICAVIAARCGVDAGWLIAGDLSQAPTPPGFAEWLGIYRKGAVGDSSEKRRRSS